MVTLLQKMYDKARSAVRIGRHQGEWFRTNVGTRQGDSLSPLLLIAYLERVMDHVKETNSRIRLGETLVNNLGFADDIDLIDEAYKSIQEQLGKTRAVAEQAGLTVNVGKTKTMVFGDRKIEQEIQIRSKNIESVEKFEYLGSLITWGNNCSGGDPEFSAQEFSARNVQHGMFSTRTFSTRYDQHKNVQHQE